MPRDNSSAKSAIELVDIVDINDKLLGQEITIKEAHDKTLPHRVSGILIFRENGNLIMQAHKYHSRKLDHSVGGHVSSGETYLQAAKREMREELGLYLPLKLLSKGVDSIEHYDNRGRKIIHVFAIYTAIVDNDWFPTPTEEVDKIIEAKPDEIAKRMNSEPDDFLQGFLTTFGIYLSSINSKNKIHAYGKNWGEL